EVALKIALQSAANRGDTKRQKFLRFHGGYHGDTFGAMAVAASSGFYDVFAPLLFPTLALAPVTTHRSALCPDGEAGLERGMTELDGLFETHGDTLAGVIIEPLVQGSSGMNMQSLTWLRHLATLARRHGVSLILDE